MLQTCVIFKTIFIFVFHKLFNMSLTQVNITEETSKIMGEKTKELRKLGYKNPETKRSYTKRFIMGKLIEIAAKNWEPSMIYPWRISKVLPEEYFDFKMIMKMIEKLASSESDGQTFMNFVYLLQVLNESNGPLSEHIEVIKKKAIRYHTESMYSCTVNERRSEVRRETEYNFSKVNLWKRYQKEISEIKKKQKKLEETLMESKEPDLTNGEIYEVREIDGENVILRPPEIKHSKIKIHFS